MSYIGVDYGTKRVGIAVSDEEGRMAFPLEVVKESEALARIRALVIERHAKGIVIGESKDFSGNDNPVMEHVRVFANELRKTTNIELFFEPEFMTSAAAAHQYDTKVGRKERPSQEKLDASAAALILQHFLDTHR